MFSAIQGDFSESELDGLMVYLKGLLHIEFFWCEFNPEEKGKEFFKEAKTWYKMNEMEFPNS